MNYNYSGSFGNPRRKTPQSMPQSRYPARETFLSRTDLSPVDKNDYAKTHSDAHKPEMPSGYHGPRPLAMVYSPVQHFTALYDKEKALSRGTLFSELDLPFEGKNCTKERIC